MSTLPSQVWSDVRVKLLLHCSQIIVSSMKLQTSQLSGQSGNVKQMFRYVAYPAAGMPISPEDFEKNTSNRVTLGKHLGHYSKNISALLNILMVIALYK